MPLTIDNDDLILLGPGFSLYFIFKKSLTIILFLFSAIVGISGTIIIMAKLKSEEERANLLLWPMPARFSIGNLTLLESPEQFETCLRQILYLNLVAMLCLFIYGVYIRRHLVKKKL